MPNCLKTYPIFLLLLTFFVGFHGYGQTHISDNLILHYNFNSNFTSGTTAVDDLSSANNDGTLQNFNFTSGLLDFDGVNDFISTTNNYSGSGPSEFTIEIWFKTTSKNLKLIGFENNQTTSATTYDRMLYINDEGKVVFAVYPGEIKTEKSSNSYNDGEWHQALATYSDINNIGKIYIDGNLETNLSANYAQPYSGYWKIGGGNLSAWPNGSGLSYSSEKFFQGNIGIVRVYHDVLSSTEVLQNYNASVGKITIVESGGDAENDTWKKIGNTISTDLNAKINASILEGFANSNTITITAESISIEEDINISTSGNGIVFKAKSDIALSSNITTNNGDVHLWSDSDGNSAGRIGIYNGGITSNGGDITLSGGTDGNSYAVGTNTSFSNFANYRGIWFNNSTLNANGTSNGGNITIKGKGYTNEITTDYNIGVDLVINSVIKTNFNGEILIDGVGGPHSTAGEHAAGINFFSQNQIFSADGAIELNGQAGGGSASNARLDAGINFDGGLSGATYDAKIYSNSGDITVKGTKSSLSNSYGIMNGIDNIQTYIGTDGTNKTSGDITIISDNFDLQDNYHTIETTGALVIKSSSNSFSTNFNTSLIDIPSSLNSLTIGTISNTANITISEDIEVAGPISLYGGHLAIQGNIESTTSGNISLKGYTEAANYGITLNNDKSVVSNNGHIDIHTTAGTTYYALNMGSNSKIEAKGVGNKLEITAIGHSTGGGIYMNTSATLSSTSDINIYANGGTDSNGIDLGSHTQIRSSAGNVHINAIGYRGVWGRNNSHSIRAYNDLTINALASVAHGIYSDNSNVACNDGVSCGWVSDEGNIIINSINKANYYYTTYLRNPLIANGTGTGKGNITYTGTSTQGGIILDSDLGYIHANGDINLIGYCGGSSGNAIHISQEGPNLTSNGGGTIRSENGDVIFSAFGAHDKGVQITNNDDIKIIAKSGDIIFQGASLSTNDNSEVDAAIRTEANTAITDTYSSILNIITTATNPRIVQPTGFPTAETNSPVKAYFWPVYLEGGQILAINNPYTWLDDNTTPSSGGNISMSGEIIQYTGTATNARDTGAGIAIFDHLDLTAYGDIDLKGNAAADGLTNLGGNHGIIIWSTTSDINSINGNISLTGYANGKQTINNFQANLLGAGVYIHSDHNSINASENINIIGTNVPGIGVWLREGGTGKGLKSTNGDINIRALNKTNDYYAAYMRQKIISSTGSVTVSAAGNYGLALDNNGSKITAAGNINLIGYGAVANGVYFYGTPSNFLESTNGSIILSANTESTSNSYYGLKSANTIKANQNIIFQGSQLNASNSGAGKITNALNASPIIFANPNDESHIGGANERAVYWEHDITATNGFVKIYGDSYISSDITSGSEILVEGENINLSGDLVTTENNSPISLLSKGHIKSNNAVSLTTSGTTGNILLASNTDNSSDGGTIRISHGLTAKSKGGNITLGGSNSNGTGYAIGENTGSYTEGVLIDNVLNLNSDGGNISIKGKTSNLSLSTTGTGNSGFGVYYLTSNGVIDSGTGIITIEGVNQNPSFTNYSSGIVFALNGGKTTTISSSNTSENAIQISAISTGPNESNYGMEVDTNSPLIIAATGEGGGVTLNTVQNATSTNKYELVARSELQVLANGGDIKLIGGKDSSTGGRLYFSSYPFFGSKSGSLVTSSSSDILLRYNTFQWGTINPRLATSGKVTIEPFNSSFTHTAIETDWFSLNQNSQTMSGLTIGKEGNTSGVTVNSSLTANGTIDIYGGDITVQRDINSSGGNGNISLWASDELTTASGRNINLSSGSGNISLFAESPVFDGGSSYTTNINTTGSFTLSPYEVVVDGFDNVSTQIEFQGRLTSGNFEGSGDIDGLTINSIENINGLTIGSASSNFSSTSGYHVLLKETADNPLSIGGPLNIYGNTITVDSPISSGGDIKVVSNNVWINDELATNAITSTIELNAANEITQTGSITSHILSLTGSGTTNLSHSGNSVNKLSAGTATITTGTLSFTNSKGLEIGANSQGIKSNGTISVRTLSGNLTITENISTTNTSENAIRLLADADTTAPNEGNGNIIISGTPTLTTGSGGRASLFSGKPASSSGLVNLVGNNNVRIGVDSSTTSFEPGLNSGVYALFRTGPKINLSERSLSIAHTSGTNSLPKSFVLSATGLTENVTLTAPNGFEISETENSGYTSSLNMTQSSGSISNTPIYVRVTNNAIGYPTGTLSATSEGAFSESLQLNATAKAALDFDGVDDYVEIPYSNELNITGDLTMATWFYLPTDYSGGSVILGRFDGTSGTNVAYSIRINGSSIYSQLGSGTAYANSSLIPIENLKGKWSHIAVSFNATSNKINIYLNSIHHGETNGSGSLKNMNSSSSKLSIGTFKGGGYNGQYFKGKIDELSIWSKALSHNEIEQQMYESLSGSENSLVAYYNFNDGVPLSDNSSNITLYDAAGNNDGTLTNFGNLSSASASTSTWVGNPFPESEIPNGYSSMPIALWNAIGTNETRESHGLTLTAPSTLSAENYVNLSANTDTGTTTSDVRITENIRSNRIWYVNETGSVSATVKIGVASATGQTVSSFVSPTFSLIRRDGTTGDFSRVAQGTRSGDVVTFTEVDLEDGYYSLGVVQNVLLTPTASQSKTLNAEEPTLSYTTSPNVSLSGTLSRTAGEDVGTYSITIGTISSSLYSITLAPENFEIVVTDPNINGWNDVSLTFGDTSAVPSYTTSATTSPSFTSSNTSVAAIHPSSGTVTATGVGTTTLWIYFPAGGQFISGTKSLTVTVLARTITVTAAAKTKVFGAEDPELTFTATPAVGAPVVTGSAATVSFTGTLTRTAGENAGTYSITLGTLSNTNYTIDYVGADFSITKAPTDIEDGDSDPATETLSDTTITFGDADLLLTPTSPNTADYTFTSSDSSVASITTTSTNTASIRNMGVGSAVISISQAADGNYQAKTVSYTLTVDPLSVSVTAAAKSKNYGDTDPSLTYVSSPAISTPLSNSSTITFTGTLSRTAGENAGTYSITLGTLSNTNYDLTFVEEDFEIHQRPITISAEAKTKVYGSADPSLTHSITVGSIVTGDTVSGVLTRTSGEAAGTYSITQNTLTYGNNYNETYEAADLTITNATLTLTVSDYTKVYDSQFIDSSNLSFTATGLVNGNSIDDLVGTPTYTVAGTATNTVGTYSVTLSGLSHPSYDIVFVGANATITPLSLSPTPTIVTFNSVGNSTWTAPATVNQVNYLVVGGGGGGGNGYDNAAGGGGGGGMVLLGEMNVTAGQSYNITVGAGGNGGANIRSNRNGTAGSNSIFNTITALGGGGGNGSRGGGSPGQAQVGSLTAPTGGGGNGGGNDGDGGGGAGGSSTDLSGSSPGIGGLGITSAISGASVTYGTGGNGGYNGGPYNGGNGAMNTGNGGGGGSSPSSNSASGGNGGSGIVILTYTNIQVDPISDIPYTGNAITFSPTVRFNGNELREGTNYTTSFTGNTNVGTASITLTGIGNFNGEKTVGFNITSKTLTITADHKTMVYNSGVYTPTDYTVSYNGFVDGEDKNVLTGTLTYTGTALTATASGTYVITPEGFTSSNYSITYVSGVLSITQKPITIAITDQTKIYGDSDPSLAHTISTGSVYGQTPTGSLTRTMGEEVGTYSISKGNLTYGSNYMETFINGELTITARTITVTAAAKTKVFGAEDPELTFTATPAVGAPVVTGSAATVTFTGTLTRTAGENAGTYSITLGTLSNTNYTIDYVGADFTITKAPTDIEDGDSDPATETLSDTTITFGDADLLLTPTSPNTADYTFTSSDSSVASITTTSTNTASIRNMGVGSAVISISQAADANYQAKTVSYTLTVDPLSVSVTAAAKSKNYGDTDPSLTYVSSPAINTPLSNSSTITFTGTLSRTAGENAGTYSITLGTLSNTNYSIDYVGTNLTIAKITPTITLNDLSVVYGDADLNLAHSATDSYTIVSPTDNSGTAKWITNGHYNSPPLTFGGNWYQPWLDAPISWAAKEASGINYYIQLDLGEEQLVSGIITQGKGSGSNHQWIKRAKIEYSSDGVNFTTAFSDTPLNSDGNSKVHTDFSTPTRMRHIRLWSTGVNQNHASVRMGAKVLNTYNSGTYTSANTSVGTISDTLFSNIGVGTTVISYTQDSSMNYLSATKTFTLTVNPLAVTVSPTSTISKIYGATDPALTFTYSPTATVNSKTITFTGELLRDVGENVGTYSITLGTLTNTNYNISLVEENFEITAKTITATLTGSVNKTYNGTVSATLHTSNFELNGFVSGESATITQTFGAYDSKNVGTNKEVSVSLSNAYAPASGTLLSNYILAATATGTVGNITAKTLTVTNITALDKVYDGSTNSNINSSTIVYNGLESGDDVSINSTSAVFDNKNVGVNKTVSLTNTYTGADLSNYTLVDQASATASITAKTITATLIGTVSKTYNGTLSATLAPSHFQLSGFVSGESATITQTLGLYDTKNVGTNKEVSVSLSNAYAPASGTLLSNYALAATATGTVGEIIPKPIDISGVTASDKQFDNTTTATVSSSTMTYTGLIGDEVIEITPSGTFADAAVGADKTVQLAYSFSGTTSGNYTSTGQVTTTASILANDNVLDFDGTNDYLLLPGGDGSVFDLASGLFTLEGYLKVHTLSSSNQVILVARLSDVSEGDSYIINLEGGTHKLQVFLSQGASRSANFAASTEPISANTWYHYALVKDGPKSFKFYLNGGLVKADTTIGSPVAIDVNQDPILGAGYYPGPSSRYSYFNGQLDEFRLWTTPKSQTEIQDNINKKMTGNETNLSVYYSFDQGVPGGDNTSISSVLDGAGTAHASWNSFTKTGTSSNFVANDRGDIKVPPTLTLTGTSKVYGDADFALSVSSTSTGTITYTSSNSSVASIDAATGSITITGVGTTTITASQTETSKYTSATATASVYIAPKPLRFSGITASDKVYDGTTAAATATNTIVFTGLVGSDQVLVNPTGTFDNSNVGVSKTVSLTYTYSGSEVSRYTITGQATTTASITTKPITIIPTASQSKTYGEANTPLTYTISPSTLPNGTAITLGGTLSRTLGENVGTYSITLGTVSNTNYDITLSPETFEITKKTVTVSGITASDKVYDANTNASVDLSGITFTGKETGDTITATATGTFDTKDIGTAKTVSLSATYSSSALANYTIVDQSSTTASITAKTVSVTGSTGLNKTYDGNTNLPLGELGYGALSGVIGSEDVTLTGVGVYDAASVGSRTIAIGTVTLTGADKDNYNLNWTNGSGTISKKTLTVTANNDAKFVGESDTSGFNGVSYSGFEGADSVSDINVSGLSITRSNSSQNDAGNYPGTLVPSGVVATNYDFNYVAGDYTIIPADKLLLRVANQTTTYGTAASYSITSAQYYKTGTGLVSLTVPTPVSGVYPINDGASTINIRVQPASPVNSTAGKLSVGSYGLSGTVVSGSSGNFSNNIEVIGSHSVAKKSLTATASGVSKVYDATTSMSGVSLGLTGLESYDLVTVNGTGAFSSPSAGTGLSYTIAGLSLAGADADNYYLSAGASFSGTNGVITKAPLTVTANNDNGVDTDPAYSGGNGVTYSGFKGLDGVSDLGGSLSYTGTSQGATAAGSYTIVPGGLTSSNYSITFVAGTLTIIVGDSDGDGVRDPLDNCPTTPNADQADADGDGVGDVCDNAPGISNPDQRDTDADGIGDVADPDDDNDGCPDTSDAFPLDPSECSDNDGDGTGDNADTDDDNDGVLDTIDNCAFTPNPTQSDIDLDGIGDVCDTDIDGDGWTNEQEQACGSNPTDATDTLTDFDRDGLPDCSDPDDDNDGYADTNDAFPLDPSEWLDTDADGTGNNADEDDDNDGQTDEEETFCGTDPLDASSFSGDVDADGITDCRDTDNDNDGVNDASDAFPLDPAEWTDTDADGIGNNADTDDDGDGFSDLDELECNSNPLDANELPADLDGDGIPDCKDTNLDGDGCLNTEDVFPRDPSECLDTDGDGLGDNVDVDDDGDGVIDLDDAFPLDPTEWADADGDGIGDNADPDDNNDGFEDEKLLVSGLLTPNSSGMESTWKIVNIEQYPNARVSVFDKNGMEVFRAQNYRNDWRGTYKNRALPAGSYLYRLNLGDGTPAKEGWLYISY